MFDFKHTIPYVSVGFAASVLLSVFSCKEQPAQQQEVVKPEPIEVKESEHRQADEALARTYLQTAREQMANGEYASAKATVEKMRDTCRLAFTAREQGILLMDSIEISLAKADKSKPDCQRRIEFYTKKLQHDLDNDLGAEQTQDFTETSETEQKETQD